MNKKAVVPLVTGVFLLVAGTLWIQGQGGMATAFNRPPSIQPQNSSYAFDLVRLKQTPTGEFVLIAQSAIVAAVPSTTEFPRRVSPPDAFSALATDSTGQKWNLKWTLRQPEAFLDGYSEGDDYIFVYLPQACPPDVKWYDVTVKNKGGASATWRVSNLQVAHQLMANEPAKTSLTFDGITVTGKAERAFFDNPSPYVPYLDCHFSATGKSRSGKNWSVRFAGFNREWEMPGSPTWQGTEDQRSFPIYIPQFGFRAQGYLSVYQGDFGTRSNTMAFGKMWTEFYPQRNHFVRVAGSFLRLQKNGKEEKVLQTVPFTLKIPIVLRPPLKRSSPSPSN